MIDETLHHEISYPLKGEERRNILEKGKTGELADTLMKLDLESATDLRQLFTISRAHSGSGRTYMPILDRNNRPFFGNRNVEVHLHTPMGVNYLLPIMLELPFIEKMIFIGHHLVKLPTNLRSWSPDWRTDETEHEELVETPCADDENIVLGTLIASSMLASQAFNHYDPGLFLVCSKYDLADIPEMPGLYDAQQEMFSEWNTVFLKYLSRIIQKEPVSVPHDSLKGLTGLCSRVVDPCLGRPNEFMAMLDGDYSRKCDEFTENPSRYLSEVGERVRETAKVLEKFRGILASWGTKMIYAKPK